MLRLGLHAIHLLIFFNFRKGVWICNLVTLYVGGVDFLRVGGGYELLF